MAAETTTSAAADRQTTTIVEWLEGNVDGRVTRLVPQPRGRPHWFAEVERDGETLRLPVRGDPRDQKTTGAVRTNPNDAVIPAPTTGMPSNVC